MSLIERGRAAWSVLRGINPETAAPALVPRPPLMDLPLQRRQGSQIVAPGFHFLPSTATRKHARTGTWDLLQAYSEIPALRLCVDLLSGARARLEFEFYRAKRAGTRAKLRELSDPRQRAMLRRAMIDSGDLEPLEEHPIQDFIRRGTPSPMLGFPTLTGYECRVMIGAQKLLTGESFTIIERRGAARGASKRGLPYGNIAVKSVDVSALPTAREPWYVVRDADGLEQNIPMEDVLYRREPNPADVYGRGSGAAHSLATELEIDQLQAEHMADSWGKGTRPDLLIVGDFAKSPGGGPFGATMSEAAAATTRLEMDWRLNVRRDTPHFFPGVDLEGRPNVSVHDLSRTMEQMQANAMRSQTWGNIAQVLGRIPPELRGETGNSNRATIEAAWYVLQTGTLLPMAVEECDFIRERILPEFPDAEGIEVDWISPVDRDFTFDLQVMTNHKEAFTLDEKRSLAGKPEIPGGKGDVFLFTPGTVPVKDPSQDPLAGAGWALSVVEEERNAQESGASDAAEDGENGEPVVAPSSGTNADDEAGSAAVRSERSGVADAVHGSALVPGQDQLDAEAALCEIAGVKDGNLGRVSVEIAGNPEQRRSEDTGQGVAEGAVVELDDRGDQDGLGAGEGDAVLGEGAFLSHAGSMYQRGAEVNRAAPYVVIDRIAAAVEPRLAALFLDAVERRRGLVDEAALAVALEDGNMSRALQVLGADDLARDLRWAGALLGEVFTDSGVVAAASLSEQLGSEVEFNRNGTRALSWAPQRSEDLAKWARESTETTARLVVDHGRESGWDGAALAGAVLLTFGLAAYLEKRGGKEAPAGPAIAVLNHRATLMEAGEPDDAARSYRDDLVRSRARMFGGDQAYSAAQGGQGEAWRQAKDSGKLPASARRYWVTRDDRRVCPVCDGLHGQKRGLDEPFTSPADGQSYNHAGPFEGPHDGCRCALLIVGLR